MNSDPSYRYPRPLRKILVLKADWEDERIEKGISLVIFISNLPARSTLELRFFHFVRPAQGVTHLERGTHPDDSGGMPAAAALSAVASVATA